MKRPLVVSEISVIPRLGLGIRSIDAFVRFLAAMVGISGMNCVAGCVVTVTGNHGPFTGLIVDIQWWNTADNRRSYSLH